jgi:phosphoenolpyruvate synthase/pyruvate phosphate dikinase
MSNKNLPNDFEVLTREIPFYLFEYHLDFYVTSLPETLGMGLNKVFCYSKNNLNLVYREVNEFKELTKYICQQVEEDDEIYVDYFRELQRLNRKIVGIISTKIKGDAEFTKLISEIEKLMHEYWKYYLTCTYIAYSVSEEYLKNNDDLAIEITKLKSKSYWVDLWNYLKPILKQRLNIKEELIDSLSLKEIRKMILNKKISIESIRERNEGYFYDVSSENMLLGEEAREELERRINSKSSNSADIVSGTSAFPGRVVGKAKIIITKNDFKKLSKNDIIVAPMTNVLFLPILSTASAIVTDEGGMTCHAAILSREMKIPCIVGTRIATKVFKDGDTLDVNADKGTAKKVI